MKKSITSINTIFLTLILNFILVAIIATPWVSYASPLKLALNWKAEPEFGGFYSAQTEGFFKNHGLNVEILEGGSGTPTIQLLAAGKVDYAIVAGDEIVLSHENASRDIVAIFATFQTNPAAIMTHKSRGFKSLPEVLTSEGTLLWQNGLPYTKYLGKKYGPLRVKTAPYLGGISNFANDKTISQQCFITSEPLLAKASKLEVSTFLVSESGFNPYTVVLATTTTKLKNSPIEVKKLIQAVREGWTQYLKSPDKANAHMANLNKAMSLEVFTESAKVQNPLIAPDMKAPLGQMSAERWTTLISQMKEISLVKKDLKASDIFRNP